MAKKILVVLDPGHYPNYNKGVAPGYYEGNKMFDLTELEKTELEKYGFKVIVTRKRDKDMDLYARGQVAVKNGKDYDEVVFISNHSNAGVASANGVEVFRSLYLPESEALAVKLCNAIESKMDAVTGCTSNKSRGVKTREGNHGDYFGVIRGSVNGAKSTAVASKGVVGYSYLIEHGFHTHAKECAFLNDDANLKVIAETVAQTLAEYFGMVKAGTSSTASKPASATEIYRVRKTWDNAKSQLGAFANLNNAKNKTDNNPGYSVFNSKGEKVYPVTVKKSNEEIAREVIAGKWGNGAVRKNKLTKAGYNPSEIQKIVNKLV